jgi:hypothetical protein
MMIGIGAYVRVIVACWISILSILSLTRFRTSHSLPRGDENQGNESY